MHPLQHDDTPISLAHTYSIDEVTRISDAFARSGYFKDARTSPQVFAKILAGQELGVGPMTAMSMIHIVDGKATMDATLVGAQIKKSGRYDFRIKQSDEHLCAIEFFERGKSVGESVFSMEDAKRAGLVSRSVWRAYPKDMLRSRAITRGARMFCPDVFNGAIYTPEEIGADVNVDESGSMTVVEPPPPLAAAPETAEATDRRRPATVQDKQLIRRIYVHLGLDPKKRDVTDHKQALETVSAALGISPAVQRWSELSVAQLEEFLALSQDVAQEKAAVAETASKETPADEPSETPHAQASGILR